jgi:hypothetical protein
LNGLMMASIFFIGAPPFWRRLICPGRFGRMRLSLEGARLWVTAWAGEAPLSEAPGA